jgi:putative spermidine/putrescine transport system permease protein
VLAAPLKYTFVSLLGVFLMAPTIVVFILSFSSATILYFPPPGYSTRWYENFFVSPLWTAGAVTSLQVGVVATVFATVLGTLTALGLVRGRFRGRALANALVLSPVIFPSVIVALAMYILALRLYLTGTLLVLVLAHTALALPFVVVNVTASLRSLDRTVEQAARSCGAGPLRTFLEVTLPLIWPGVAAGALFAFITSWDEVVVAFFLSTPLVQTLPVVIWAQVREDIDPTVAAASSMVTALSLGLLALMVLAQWWSGRLRAQAE